MNNNTFDIWSKVKRIVKVREVTLLFVLIIMGIILSLLSNRFFTSGNIFNVMRQISLIVILAMGEAFVLISGCIDLSLGANVGLSGVILAIIYQSTGNPLIALLGGLFIGTIVGLVNGLLVSKANINPFIATLGTLSIIKGSVLIITNANYITFQNKTLSYIGQGYVGIVPVPVIIMTIFVIIFHIILNYTVFGSRLKATGGNEDAARVSGINTQKYKIYAFIISGFMSAITGLIMACRISTGQPEAGIGWELDAIAACVVGGTAFTGGEGSIIGAVIGSAIIGFLSNGLIMLGVSSFVQPIFTGVLIIVVVGLNGLKKQRV